MYQWEHLFDKKFMLKAKKSRRKGSNSARSTLFVYTGRFSGVEKSTPDVGTFNQKVYVDWHNNWLSQSAAS
jgi:hypothetical protein